VQKLPISIEHNFLNLKQKNMKNPFKPTCNKSLQVQNVYIECPQQAVKCKKHFDRFNLQLYLNYLKAIQ
jgi:hypothetical protein